MRCKIMHLRIVSLNSFCLFQPEGMKQNKINEMNERETFNKEVHLTHGAFTHSKFT